MRISLSTLLVFLVMVGSGSADAYAQAPGAASAKRYPWDMRQPKCFLPDAIPSAQCKANDWPDYGESKRHVDRLLVEPDFDLIERAENELEFSEKQFASGYYYFDAWFLSLDQMSRYQSQRLYQVVSDWAKAKGEGGYVKLVEALLRYGEGRQARQGYSNTVTPEAQDIYWRKLREANEILDSASDRLKRTAPWYVVKLRFAYQLAELKGSREKLLATASGLWPEYVKIYTAAMEFSLPVYGGSYEQVDEVARFAVERTKAKWGASWYAIVYQQLGRFVCECTLADSQADWDLMKQAFRDYEARGGANESTYKAYADMACVMRDRKEARRLLEQSDKLSPNRPAGPPDPCREFAFSTA